MTNLPYEERIKNRDNNWYYNKCIRQYHFIIKSISANERYKEEIARLNKIIDELKENIQNLIYDIQPKGCLIIFNCEYDSEEDYIKGMKKEERLRTLEEVLDKLEELKEEGN